LTDIQLLPLPEVKHNEIDEQEGGPGISDTYYWVAVDYLDSFRTELREIILSA
jgi:hypothetical protein